MSLITRFKIKCILNFDSGSILTLHHKSSLNLKHLLDCLVINGLLLISSIIKLKVYCGVHLPKRQIAVIISSFLCCFLCLYRGKRRALGVAVLNHLDSQNYRVGKNQWPYKDSEGAAILGFVLVILAVEREVDGLTVHVYGLELFRETHV